VLCFFGPYVRRKADIPDRPKASAHHAEKRHFLSLSLPMPISLGKGHIPSSYLDVLNNPQNALPPLPIGQKVNGQTEQASRVKTTNARKKYSAAGFIVLRPDAAITVAKFYVHIKGIIVNTNM